MLSFWELEKPFLCLCRAGTVCMNMLKKWGLKAKAHSWEIIHNWMHGKRTPERHTYERGLCLQFKGTWSPERYLGTQQVTTALVETHWHLRVRIHRISHQLPRSIGLCCSSFQEDRTSPFIFHAWTAITLDTCARDFYIFYFILFYFIPSGFPMLLQG